MSQYLVFLSVSQASISFDLCVLLQCNVSRALRVTQIDSDFSVIVDVVALRHGSCDADFQLKSVAPIGEAPERPSRQLYFAAGSL